MAQKLPNVFSIGWLVERYGVSPESIRNWERQGLIPQTSRTPGGHRRYNRAHVDALDTLFGYRHREDPKPSDEYRREVSPQVTMELAASGASPQAMRRPSEDLAPLVR